MMDDEAVKRAVLLTQMQGEPAAEQRPQSDKDRGLFYKVGLPAIIGGNVLDAITTAQAIKSGRGTEANPVLGNGLGRNMALKAAGTAGIALMANQMAKKHPKAATIASLIAGAIPAIIGIHNTRVGR